MKKLLFLIFIFCSIMFSFESNASVSVTLTNQTSSTSGKGEEPDDPRDKGRRSAPVPIYCVIDFDNNTVTGDAMLDEITIYQIWNENGEACLSVAYDACTFVDSLKSLPSRTTYMIVLNNVTPNR